MPYQTTPAGKGAYLIPSAESLASPLAKYGFFFIPGIALVCAILGATFGGSKSVEKFFEFGITGFFVGIPFTIIATIVGSIVTARRLKSNWARHNYQWYREQFPSNVRDNRITCRHCGSGNVRTSNLMNKTYMRLHACGQCGETLYFTPEGI